MKLDRCLAQFHSMGNVIGQEEGFDQFAFTAGDHAGKTLEPRADGNLWIFVQPDSEDRELICGDAAIPDTIKKMPQHGWRKVLAANLGHGSGASVKAIHDLILKAAGC
jgi:hypothetical protein